MIISKVSKVMFFILMGLYVLWLMTRCYNILATKTCYDSRTRAFMATVTSNPALLHIKLMPKQHISFDLVMKHTHTHTHARMHIIPCPLAPVQSIHSPFQA